VVLSVIELEMLELHPEVRNCDALNGRKREKESSLFSFDEADCDASLFSRRV